ncbi:MAG TPA: cytochrome c, partial [Terriglobales bacterium]
QHANMLLRVTVDEPAEFERWLAHEAEPAAVPANSAAKEGQSTFLAQSCVNCHRVRGTRAGGTFGPDLTHLMSRATIASGAAENTKENLRQWIKEPDAIKPGCLMPAMQMSEQDIDSVTAYLMTLH